MSLPAEAGVSETSRYSHFIESWGRIKNNPSYIKSGDTQTPLTLYHFHQPLPQRLRPSVGFGGDGEDFVYLVSLLQGDD